MRVYYLTGSKHVESNISRRRLKVSRISKLNDPFELIGVDRTVRQHRPEIRQFRERMNATTGIICFSETWHNPVMWSHYGERHQGACFEFEIPEEKLRKVIYSSGLFAMQIDTETKLPVLNAAAKQRLLRTKFRDWKYEKEWRLVVKLRKCDEENGLHFVPFSKEVDLRRIILGPQCKLELSAIRNLVARFNPGVEVIRARLAFRTYRVVKNRAASNKAHP